MTLRTLGLFKENIAQEKAGLAQVHKEQMQHIQQHYELLLSKQKDDFEEEKVKYMKQRQTDFD